MYLLKISVLYSLLNGDIKKGQYLSKMVATCGQENTGRDYLCGGDWASVALKLVNVIVGEKRMKYEVLSYLTSLTAPIRRSSRAVHQKAI